MSDRVVSGLRRGVVGEAFEAGIEVRGSAGRGALGGGRAGGVFLRDDRIRRGLHKVSNFRHGGDDNKKRIEPQISAKAAAA